MRYRIVRTKEVRDVKEVRIVVGNGIAENAQALDEAIRSMGEWNEHGDRDYVYIVERID